MNNSTLLNGFYASCREIKEDDSHATEVLVHYTHPDMHEHIEAFLEWLLDTAHEDHKFATLTLIGEFTMWWRERDTTR